MLETEIDHLRNAEPREACAEFGSGIGDGQPAVDGDANALAAAPELPIEGTPGRRVDGEDTLMRVARQILRLGRPPVPLDVGRRGNRQNPCIEQAPRDQR